MRPVQIPCRFFRQVIDSAYLCRTCIDDSKLLCCLFIIIYDIIVILSEASAFFCARIWAQKVIQPRAEGPAVRLVSRRISDQRKARPAPQDDGRSPGLEAEEEDALEEVYEPFLIQIGFLDRTPKGRCATRLAYEHFGLPLPRKQAGLF